MERYEKKPKINANLVRRYDEKHYRILSDEEMCRLKFHRRVIPEPGKRPKEDKTFHVSYYIEED